VNNAVPTHKQHPVLSFPAPVSSQ